MPKGKKKIEVAVIQDVNADLSNDHPQGQAEKKKRIRKPGL